MLQNILKLNGAQELSKDEQIAIQGGGGGACRGGEAYCTNDIQCGAGCCCDESINLCVSSPSQCD